jgi:2-C-methyl-D-erythritol 4-phosphate cytidylyltransferase
MGDTAAIVVAGGRGVRVGGTVPKQFIRLGGLPLYQYSLHALWAAGIEAIVVVVPVDFTEQVNAEVAPFEGAVRVTRGGERRQDSVAAGFALIEKGTSIVLIHDAARPLLPLSVISRVARGAEEHGAAVAAVPVPDTLKKSEDDELVSATLDRRGLYLAQTPQGFSRSILAEIIALEIPGIEFTDEAMGAERIGIMPRLVPGSSFCFKTTTRDDLVMARALLSMLAQEGADHADWSWLRYTSAG